jgi:hypothetical protein
MSTKTTIKRIALVAVAAVGFGMLSALPSQATINQDSLVLSSATAAQTTAETKTATSAVATAYFFGVAGDSMSVTAALVSAPAGNTSLPILQLIDTTSATVDTTLGASQVAGYLVTPNTATKVAAISSSVGTQARFAVFLSPDVSTGLTAPTVAGTYVVKLTPATVGSSGALNAAVAQLLTITVTTASTLSTVATTATLILNSGETNSATTDATVSVVKTADFAAAAGAISVALKNAAGTTAVESYTATISGQGTLSQCTFGASACTQTAAVGRALTVKYNDGVAIYADGTSGVGTVTITAASGAILGSKSVTFFGAVDKIVAKANTPVIGVRNLGAGPSAKAIVFNAYDAAGVEIKAGISTVYLNSDAPTVVTGTYTSATPTYDATTLKAWYVDVTALKAGNANITVTTNSAATVTTGKTANAVSLRVAGGTAAASGTNALSDVIVAFDKATYAPGEAAVITVTPVDSAGLILADDTYTVFATGGMVPDYSFYGTVPTLTGINADNGGVAGIGTSLGVASYKVFMPISEGTVTVKYTTATAVGSTTGAIARTITAVVSSTSGSAAIEAANAAQASADAATDAANAAAESADAATAAAQDAAQAVADLATQVADLIASLKAQLTALTALVVKIQKKVKA